MTEFQQIYCVGSPKTFWGFITGVRDWVRGWTKNGKDGEPKRAEILFGAGRSCHHYSGNLCGNSFGKSQSGMIRTALGGDQHLNRSKPRTGLALGQFFLYPASNLDGFCDYWV